MKRSEIYSQVVSSDEDSYESSFVDDGDETPEKGEQTFKDSGSHTNVRWVRELLAAAREISEAGLHIVHCPT